MTPEDRRREWIFVLALCGPSIVGLVVLLVFVFAEVVR